MKAILLLLLMPLGVLCQYVPFPEDSATWVYYGWEAYNPPNIDRYHRSFRVSGTVEIDSVKLVKCNSTFYYRNDSANKKVYKVSVDMTKPAGSRITSQDLWYDFSLEVGDSIHGSTFIGTPAVARLNSVDSVIVNGRPLKRLHFISFNVSDSTAIRSFYWIEGVGSNWDFMNPVSGPFFEADEYLACFQSVDFPYSINPENLDSTECWNPTFEVGEFEVKDQVEIYPNPSRGEFTLWWGANNAFGRGLILRVFNAQGVLVAKEQAAVNKAESYRMSLQLKPGSYFVEVGSDEGVVQRLPLIIRE